MSVTEKRTKTEIDFLVDNLKSLTGRKDYPASAENKIEPELENQRN